MAAPKILHKAVLFGICDVVIFVAEDMPRSIQFSLQENPRRFPEDTYLGFYSASSMSGGFEAVAPISFDELVTQLLAEIEAVYVNAVAQRGRKGMYSEYLH